MTNLLEILKNAPKGLELYSPVYGKVKLNCVKPNDPYPIAVEREFNIWVDEYGRINENGECVLFPSKENREWDNWQKTLIKVGHFVALDVGCGIPIVMKVKYISTWNERIRFATTEEIEQWYKYRATAKTKEEPTFTIDDFKPFDKVLVKDNRGCWKIQFFSHYKASNSLSYACLFDCEYKYCVPYNDETKHLLGTTEEYNGKYKTW